MIRRMALFLCVLLLGGCGNPAASAGNESAAADESTIDFFAMDTYMSVRAYGADRALMERITAMVQSLEGELSATDGTSAVHALNADRAAELSEDGGYLLRRALALCAETGGALDISIYPIVRAWGFTSADGAYRVPDGEEIAALLRNVDYSRIRCEGTQAWLPAGMEIDLGAVAKGFTGDKIAALLREAGVESALLDLGGNIQTVGTKPDGSAWRVAIRSPEGEDILGVIPVADQAVITSGGYERYFVDDQGRLWWHIMDPFTGYPAQSGLVSVTVVGDEGLYCDALSTALFILGEGGAIRFWREHSDFEMALVTAGNELILTPGLAAIFTPSDHLPYEIRVITETP